MMATAINGDPLPPEHTQPTQCVSSTNGVEDESKHPNASIILLLPESLVPKASHHPQ